MDGLQGKLLLFLVPWTNWAGPYSRIHQRKQHYLSSLILKGLLNAFNGNDIVGLMREFALLPQFLWILLEEVEIVLDALWMGRGVEEVLVVAEWTAEDVIFIIGNWEYSALSFRVFLIPEIAHPFVTIKHYTDSNVFLELVTFNDTFQALYYGGDYSELNHRHAQLDYY